MDSYDKNMWRVLSIFTLMCFFLILVYLHFCQTISQLLIPSIITVCLLIFLIIKPTLFPIYGFISCSWGIIYIVYKGALFGFFLYGLGIAFFYKAGFFKKFKSLKKLIFAIVAFVALASIYRLGIEQLLGTSLQVLGIVFIISAFTILFEDNLHILHKIRSNNFMENNVFFSELEESIADFLLLGKKYSQIAEEIGVSDSTIKRSVQKMCEKLQAKNKADFIEKYKILKIKNS